MNDIERQARLDELKSRADEYASDKAVEGVLKKKIENNNTSIKGLMELLETDQVETSSGAVVCYSVRTKEELDENMLLEQLKKYAPGTQCIKTKEYVDMDILESEIYHEKLSDEAMKALDECRKVKEIPTLTIKKAKKEK